MKPETLLFVVALSVIAISGGEAYPGVIIRHPETQTTPAGGDETFVCTGQGDVIWYINSQWLSPSYEQTLEGKGYTFIETYLSGTEYPSRNLTMTVPATNNLNGTKIQCRTSGNDGIAVSSNLAWLWIVAPPLPPNVSVVLTSWNTMQLSWTAPFTAEGFPIIKYIVNTTNTTTGQRTRTDIYPSSGAETHIILDSPSDCHTLQFEVFAESSAGLSTAEEVSRGFPVAVSEFDVNVSVVLLLEDLTPQSIISFHLPDICSDSGVSATYILELKNSSGGVVQRMTVEYWHSIFIEEKEDLSLCDSYTINVTVFVPSYAELGSYTTIRDIPTKCPGDGDDTPSTEPVLSTGSADENSIYMPVLLSVVGVVAILSLLMITCLAPVCFVQWRRKTMRRRSTVITNRSMPPMASNPIYDANDVSPVYDEIPDCAKAKQQHTFKKQVSFDHRYTSTPSSLPLRNEPSTRNRSVSVVSQSPLSPQTPSPREVDAMLRNTFGGTPSPLSQQCSHGGSMMSWGGEESGVYDTLSREQGKEGEKSKGGNVEREDCYVFMQSNAV